MITTMSGLFLKRWLQEGGYHVIEATGGREAVEMAERERPELILMDLALPEIDGFAAQSESVHTQI